jgi:alpha-L-rhamnosidase
MSGGNCMIKPTNLKCEYLINPIGIGTTKPRFGWMIQSDKQNVVQTSYELHVSKDRDFKDLLWNSGMVEADESAHVYYEGPILKSKTRYYFRVRIGDNHGELSDFSETAFLETTLFSNDEWQARFITAEGSDDGKSSKGTLLRKEFGISKEIESARVYATALGMYELHINGNRVGDALFTPGWTAYNERLQFQTYDVTEMLKHGLNAIGAVIGAGWYKGDLAGWIGRRNVYGDKTALLLQMNIRFKDGSEMVIASDDEWKASDGPVLFSELYHGETYDARLEKIGWDKPSCDDSTWGVAQYVDFDLKKVVPQDGVYVKRQQKLKPISIFVTPKGERVIDFGQNLAGWVKFKVSGNTGDKVVLKHAEVLDKDGNFYIENMRAAKVRIEYILKGHGEEIFEPHFTFQGFRYVLVEEFPGNPSLENFEAIVVHSDMERTGTFSCSNELINQLSHNILWGLKGNFVDIPTDCPQRDERLGWTGDAQVFISTACYLMDTALFFRKWLRDLKAEQLENGGVPFVIPDVLSNNLQNDKLIKEEHSATGWADAAVICPWTVYQTYGDVEVLKEQYETMKKWIGYMKVRAADGLIWNTGFHFGDWVALDAKEGSYFGATPNDLKRASPATQ